MGFEIVSSVLLAFLTNGLFALILMPVTAMGAVMTHALQALMSRRTPDSQEGKLQGVLAVLYALSTIFSPLVMTSVFAHFVGQNAPVYLPGAPLFLRLS